MCDVVWALLLPLYGLRETEEGLVPPREMLRLVFEEGEEGGRGEGEEG